MILCLLFCSFVVVIDTQYWGKLESNEELTVTIVIVIVESQIYHIINA